MIKKRLDRNVLVYFICSIAVRSAIGQHSYVPLEDGIREHFRVERIIQLPRELIVGDHHIFLENGGSPGFVFNRNGTCLQGPVGAYRSARTTAIDDDGFMWGQYDLNTGSDSRIVKKMTFEGRETFSFALKKDVKYPNLERRFIGGGLVARGDFIYHLNVGTPTIYKYNKSDGKLVAEWALKIKGFKPLVQDIPASASDPGFFKASRANKDATKFLSLLTINESDLLVGFTDTRGYNFAIVDSAGSIKLQSYSASGHYFFAVKNAEFYRVKQPAASADGTLSNPIIEVLRLMH